MSWDDAARQANEVADGGFLKLADKQTVDGLSFVGDPQMREVVWDQSTNRSYAAASADGQRLISEGERKKTRWIIGCGYRGDVIEWECSNKVFKNDLLEALKERDRKTHFFKIKRLGMGTDTTYRITPDREMTRAEREIFAIQDKQGGGASGGNGAANGNSADAVAASANAVALDAIRGALAGLKPGVVVNFLAKFHANDFDEIPAEQFSAALAEARRVKESEGFLSG